MVQIMSQNETSLGTSPVGNYRFLLEKSPEDKRDYIAEDILDTSVAIPTILDYSTNMPPVRDQGSQGSCAAMAAAAIKDWQERQDIAYAGYMSPQFIYNLRPNAPGEGMYSRDLMKILNKSGTVFEADYPYGSMGSISDDLKTKALNYVVKEYSLVTTVAGLKTALCTSGPCLLTVPVYNYGLRLWYPEEGQPFLGGHAMAVVGYNSYGFLIRNSWGAGWGVFGYTLFPYSDWDNRWEAWTTIDADSPDIYIKKGSQAQDWRKARFGK
jgi:C1A family cysteine protease